jgi:hypothetical protein
MVSLKQRQALSGLSEADQRLKRFQLFLAGENIADADSRYTEVREELLSAIISKDSVPFKNAAAEIGRRKISTGSDWCQDDYLLLLLVVGNELFGHPLTFLRDVIEVRRNNPNPIPRKINEVFAALERGDFGINGKFCFLKIPFLHLTGKLRLGPSEARQALRTMSEPGLFDQLPPVFQLLMQKAYDLVLTERQPVATKTTAQLIGGIESHAKELSLRQWWQLLTALPGRMVMALIAALIAILFSTGLLTVLVGFGKGLVESRNSAEVRKLPASISVLRVGEPSADLPTEILLLVKTLAGANNVEGHRPFVIAVEGAPWSSATPPFVVEVSHPDRPINNALAFTRAALEGARSFTIIPIQRDGGRFRAILPEQPKGQHLLFLLQLERRENEDLQTVGGRVVLRPLQ